MTDDDERALWDDADIEATIARLQAGGGDVMLFSALKRQGVAEAACWLRARVEQAGGPEQALA